MNHWKPETSPEPFGLRRWMTEPLVQFMLAGLFLFSSYYILNPDRRLDTSSTLIEITDDDLRQMTLAWIAQGRAAPGQGQLEALVSARVREEILYREALSLGLDQQDTIVRRRLAQKMEFLTEDSLPLQEPTVQDLRDWQNRHPERFETPARVSFRHVYFSPDRRGTEARQDAELTLSELPDALDEPEAVGDPFMFEDMYDDRPRDQLSMLFGETFASRVMELPTGSWQGPIESGYGWHLVQLTSKSEARQPDFETIEADVREAWIDEQRDAARERAFEAIRDRYEVVIPPIPGPPQIATASR